MTDFEKVITDELINEHLNDNGSDIEVHIVSVEKEESQFTSHSLWVNLEMIYKGESRGVFGYRFYESNYEGDQTATDLYILRTLDIVMALTEDILQSIKLENLEKLKEKL